MQSHQPEQDIATWWSVVFLVIFFGSISIMIAVAMGPTATQSLMMWALTGIFLFGGVLLGYLGMHALGGSQRWNLLDVNETLSEQSSPEVTRPGQSLFSEENPLSAGDLADRDEPADPFVEIMRRRAA